MYKNVELSIQQSVSIINVMVIEFDSVEIYSLSSWNNKPRHVISYNVAFWQV